MAVLCGEELEQCANPHAQTASWRAGRRPNHFAWWDNTKAGKSTPVQPSDRAEVNGRVNYCLLHTLDRQRAIYHRRAKKAILSDTVGHFRSVRPKLVPRSGNAFEEVTGAGILSVSARIMAKPEPAAQKKTAWMCSAISAWSDPDTGRKAAPNSRMSGTRVIFLTVLKMLRKCAEAARCARSQ